MEMRHKLNKCNFCGSPVPYRLKYKITGNIISVDGFIPGKNCNILAPYYCGGKECPGKRLNRNSLSFVQLAYGVDGDTALKLIHSRNSTPFYPENHESLSDYKNYQRHQSQKQTKESIAMGAYHRSLEYLCKVLGEELGTLAYKTINERKKHTKATYIERYGPVKGSMLWIAQKNLRSVTTITCFKDLYTITLNALTSVSTDELRTTRPDLLIKKKYGYPIVKRYIDFNTTLDEVLHVVFTDHPHLNIFDKDSYTRTVFGHWSYTPAGTLLRSKAERAVYNLLVENGLQEGVDFLIDKPYSKQSKHRYDFYLIKIDTYIEVAGIMSNPVYVQNLITKTINYPVVIVTPNNYITKIKELINAIKSTPV
jgi:hypothetical protein